MFKEVLKISALEYQKASGQINDLGFLKKKNKDKKL